MIVAVRPPVLSASSTRSKASAEIRTQRRTTSRPRRLAGYPHEPGHERPNHERTTGDQPPGTSLQPDRHSHSFRFVSESGSWASSLWATDAMHCGHGPVPLRGGRYR